MQSIPLVDLKAEYYSIKTEIDTAIQQVIQKTNFIMGEEVGIFENNFARFCNAQYCVGVASGTAALHLAILACGIKPGDEVITTSHSFIATAEAISYCGAKPVFVDIHPQTYTIDPEQIKSKITSKAKAILPVHLYGQPADMNPIREIAEQYGLKVIEDAAQAHGAIYRGENVGMMGNAACFSFYPGKNLGAYGDAGAVVTNSVSVAEMVFVLRNHGRERGVKYEHSRLGYGERIDTLQAAILNAKLQYLDRWTEKRRELARRYNSLLLDTNIITPQELPDVRHVYHLYVVRHPKRDFILKFLQENKIGAGVHYPLPLHLQPAYKELGYKEGDFPQAEKTCKEVFSLPLYPEMEYSQQDAVVASIKDALQSIG